MGRTNSELSARQAPGQRAPTYGQHGKAEQHSSTWDRPPVRQISTSMHGRRVAEGFCEQAACTGTASMQGWQAPGQVA